jgi:hypothetical protein
MTETTQREGESQKPAPARAYHRPQLLVYGALRDLTASGTTGDPERGKFGQPSKLMP